MLLLRSSPDYPSNASVEAHDVPRSRTRVATIEPRHKRLGNAGYRATRALLKRFFAGRSIHSLDSDFAAERLNTIRAKLDRGETVYLAGINCAGMHNSGVALVQVIRGRGPVLICNHEEERFSGNKHATEFPIRSLAAFLGTM